MRDATVVALQRRHLRLRVEGAIGRAELFAVGEIDPLKVERRADLLHQDMDAERAAAGGSKSSMGDPPNPRVDPPYHAGGGPVDRACRLLNEIEVPEDPVARSRRRRPSHACGGANPLLHRMERPRLIPKMLRRSRKKRLTTKAVLRMRAS